MNVDNSAVFMPLLAADALADTLNQGQGHSIE